MVVRDEARENETIKFKQTFDSSLSLLSALGARIEISRAILHRVLTIETYRALILYVNSIVKVRNRFDNIIQTTSKVLVVPLLALHHIPSFSPSSIPLRCEQDVPTSNPDG
eukprot:gb/GEZJ01007561.1/.p3 GENE.gb/GEZJ01007561.1/~~gb/GEZJ01007561.1/.p3  ORF type:complete len:111 (+),score=6.31 gb/GEZJ01007561.1/:294-626(+)